MNKIITISGNDLRGKASQNKLLAEVLGAKVFTFPNYDSLSGQLVRGALTNSRMCLQRELSVDGRLIENVQSFAQWNKNDLSPYHFQCTQMLSRIEAQEDILKALEVSHVCCDRYDLCAKIYGSVDGCKRDWLESFLKCVRRSDLVIVLTGPKFCREEFADSNETDSDFSRRVDEAYESESKLALAEGWNIKTVNTVQMPDKYESILYTHHLILNVVNEFLNENYQPLNIDEIRKLV